MKPAMTIARAARAAGVGIETVRFYERRGLIRQPRKPANGGYREYDAETVERVRFIRQAQDLGFSLRETKELLALRADPRADCSDVRARAVKKRDEVEQKLRQLKNLRRALEALIANCPGGGALRACTILDAIGQAAPQKPKGKSPPVSRPQRRIVIEAAGTGAMKTATFSIKGMNCDGCARTIEAVVGREDGVRKIEASFAEAEARILYEPDRISEAALAVAIERIGFRAKVRKV
jgi:DNA-binding transcriptional MerR regulator/copper chaperone CopZ